MIDKEECLRILAKCRTDEVMVTSMGTTMPWSEAFRPPA